MQATKRKAALTENTVKRTKSESYSTKEKQGNTLLNYFKTPTVTAATNTLLHYFKKPEPTVEDDNVFLDTNEYDNEFKKIKKEVNTTTTTTTSIGGLVAEKFDQNVKKEAVEVDTIKKVEIKSEWSKIFTKTLQVKTEETTKTVFEDDIKKDENGDSEKKDADIKYTRKCPFYKFISNTPITVDAFNFGVINNCNAYFLSHFHYDHYIGLSKSFAQTLYCSEVTGNLVIQVLKVDPKCVKKLPMNKFVNVFDKDPRYKVALLDANHCPGSVMFLFYLPHSKQYILHTGDFRASERVVLDPVLRDIKLDMLYLDTTYCDAYYKFERQEAIISLGVNTVKAELKKYPQSLIVCGSYTIGKERVFVSIAQSINSKICVKREKKRILDCVNDVEISNILTIDPKETNLHVLPMGSLNMTDLVTYLDGFPQYNRVIGIKPTGWTHNSDSGLSVDSKRENAIIYGLAYSEHSSFNELKHFVQHHRPKTILPTVNNGSKASRDKMTRYFEEWLKPV